MNKHRRHIIWLALVTALVGLWFFFYSESVSGCEQAFANTEPTGWCKWLM